MALGVWICNASFFLSILVEAGMLGTSPLWAKVIKIGIKKATKLQVSNDLNPIRGDL